MTRAQLARPRMLPQLMNLSTIALMGYCRNGEQATHAARAIREPLCHADVLLLWHRDYQSSGLTGRHGSLPKSYITEKPQ